MKKLFLAVLTLLCASALVVQAQDAKPKHKAAKLTTEQKAVMKDMLAKYDTNKDGKLDKTEKLAISKEDKEKMTAAGLGKKKKGTDATTTDAAPAATPAPATTK